MTDAGPDRRVDGREILPGAVHHDPEWRVVDVVGPSTTTRVRWLVAGVVAFFCALYGFERLRAAMVGTTVEPIVVAAPSPSTLSAWLAFVAIGALVVVVHEACHGVAIARYGGRPTFGVRRSRVFLPYAYAETGGSYGRDQFLVVLLAPLVAITAVALIALAIYPSAVLSLALAINVAGSVVDCWFAARVRRYPSSVRVAGPSDDGAGLSILGRDGDRPPTGSVLEPFVAGAAGTLAAVGVAAFALIAATLATGGGDVVLGRSDGWYLLRHEVHPAGGRAHLAVGEGPLLALAALGGVGRILLSRPWR